MKKVYAALFMLFGAALLLSMPNSATKIPSALEKPGETQISLR